MNLPNRDPFGEAELDEITASVGDTLRKLRLAVLQLDNEVSDLSYLKCETLKAIPTTEERRASILRQLDSSAQEGNLTAVRLDDQLLQGLTQCHCSITGKEFPCTALSQEATTEVINNRHIEALVESAQEDAKKSFFKLAPFCKGDSCIVILFSVEASRRFRGRRAGDYSRILFKLNQQIVKYFLENKETVLDDPQVNSACIVKTSLQQTNLQKYQRARIVSVSGDEIGVFFVDVGERTFVTRELVLDIPVQFLKVPETAVEGKLGRIIPSGGSTFSNNVLDKIKSKVLRKEVVLRVSKGESTTAEMEALLIEVDQGVEKCINSWLVFEGDAYFAEEPKIKSNETKRNAISTRRRTPSSSTYSCHVISVISPARIYLRKLSDLNDSEVLAMQMKVHYSSSVEFEKVIYKSGTLAAIFTSESWDRARILKVRGSKVDLFLLDRAEEIKANVEDLKPLPVCFCTKNYTEECHLSRIVPNTKSGSWSKGSIEALRSVLKEGRMIVDVENDGKAGHGSQPVKLYVDIIDGPANIRSDLAQKLVSLGFASNIVEKQRPIVCPRTETEFSLPSLGDLADEEELFLWPEPILPESSIFDAEATYVDWDGVISLMTRVNKTNVKMINDAINEHYLDSSPEPEDLFWRVGEAAIVCWHQDNKWYRACVLRVLPNHCEVRLVDYGTETFTPFISMRKRLVAEKIPIQSIPFKLANVEPIGGEWTEEQLTTFHQLVVDKVLTITNVEESQARELLIGNAKLVDNDVSETLISEEICIGKGI